MKPRILRLLVAVILVLGTQTILGAQDFLREIAQLYKSGQPQAAYSLANEHLLEAEGDPDFDYYYGLAAIDSGYLSQGVFALERVLALRPDHQVARLELARGYFLLEQYDRARKEFRRVLETRPPAKVRENIQHFLDLIRLRESTYRTTAGYYLELSAGYDTNANSAPSVANFVVPALGIGVLSGDSLSQEDAFAGIEAGANLIHPIKQGVSLFGNLTYSQRTYEENAEFDLKSYNVEGGIDLLREKDRYKIKLQWQNFNVGHADYRDLLSLGGEWQRALTNRSRLFSFFQYAKMNFPNNGSRDSNQAMIGGGVTHSLTLPLRPLLYASLYGGEERASEDSRVARSIVDRDIYGMRLGALLTFSRRFSLDLSAQVQKSRYDEEDRFFLLKREDEYRKLTIKGTWLLQPRWSLIANLAYMENDANITINRYHRAEGSLSLRYEY